MELMDPSSAKGISVVDRKFRRTVYTAGVVCQAVGVGRPLGEVINLGVRLAGGENLGSECGREAY
jgi:hypothetical protein